MAGAFFGLYLRFDAWTLSESKLADPHKDWHAESSVLFKDAPDGIRRVETYSEPELANRIGSPVTSRIIDVRSGKVLFEFRPPAFEQSMSPFFVSKDELVWLSWRRKNGEHGVKFNVKDFDVYVTKWRRRRPEYWWGIAWLPEFWLTAVFGIALIWSLRRDWKRLRGKKAGVENANVGAGVGKHDRPQVP